MINISKGPKDSTSFLLRKLINVPSLSVSPSRESVADSVNN